MALQSGSGKINEALELFAEAERFVGNDVDFSVDYAKALGIAGAEMKSSMHFDKFAG